MNEDNVTVMSADELDIKDEDLKKMETKEVTLDVNVQLYFKHCESHKGVISFVLSDVPVNTPDETLKGYAINALHDALLKEEFLKCKVGTGVMLLASGDVSRVLIENVAVRKGE
mgnify:CR=1 FL=1